MCNYFRAVALGTTYNIPFTCYMKHGNILRIVFATHNLLKIVTSSHSFNYFINVFVAIFSHVLTCLHLNIENEVEERTKDRTRIQTGGGGGGRWVVEVPCSKILKNWNINTRG